MIEVTEQLDRIDDDQQIEFNKRPGTSGASKGHKYEIKLAMLFLLQGKITKEIENFYLASNMDGVGAFDDVVFKYSYNEDGVNKTRIIFLQAKHKESTKVFNLDSMFPRGKSDFDLRKYLRSYEDIKQQFETNRNNPLFENEFDNSNYIIFTNTSFDFNNCKEDVEEYGKEQEHFLNLKNDYYKIKDSDKVMRALRKSPNSNMRDEDEDAEIKEFLNKLQIFDSQFNEEELEEEINEIIKSSYLVDKSEAALIFFEVYREVESWWQSEKTYLTKKNRFFEKAKENVSKRSLDVLASLGRAQMNALKLQFEEDHVKKIKELIHKNQIFNIVTKTVTLTNAKVYQALENMTEYESKEDEENDYKYLFISSELTRNIQNKIINTFKSTQFNLLVLECERNKDNFKSLCVELSNIIKGNDNKKVIMIGQENKRDTVFDSMGCKYEKYEDTEILSNLTDTSQQELINNLKAIFQGEEVILGELLKDKSLRKFVDKNMLSELINTSRLNIGKSLNNLGEIEKYYINRIFNRQVKIKADFKNESIFFITKNSEITEIIIELIEDIVLISDIEGEFYKICTDKNYKTKNIHWLKDENRVFTWQQSRGSLLRLRNFIDTEITDSVEEEDMIKNNDKLVIISAEPGMGKSTILTKLAEQIKNSDPSLWVQTINLNDYSDQLDEMDLRKERKEETIKLLLNMVKPKPGLETELFKRRIDVEGKIVLLLDGFDEISPTYDNKVIELLNVLKYTKTDKLWVTTRPHLRKQLEDKLGVVAYTLKALSEDNQKTFLKKFWNGRLGLDIELDNRSESYICELLDILKKSITDKELEFTGVPLQTRMLAEVYQDKFKDFHDFEDEVPNFHKTLDLLYLYQEFIDKKCRIFYEEKKGVSLTKTAIKKEYDKHFYPNFLRNHKILGIDLIFYEENEFLSMDELNDLKKFKNDFNEEDDKTGIVIQILNNKPIFVHRTFGEYFAALWFAEKVEEDNKCIKSKLLKYIFKNGYEFLKIVLDRLLTKDECKIHNAILNNDEKKVKLLLDDNKIFDKGGRTAIHLAASYGYENILKILLENSKKEGSIFNYKIDTKDEVFNLSALMHAVESYHGNTIELLLQNGANSDDMFKCNGGINERMDSVAERTVTLIHLAAEKGCMKLIEVILQNGKDSYHIDIVDTQGRTPLFTAVKNKQIEVIKLLVDNGANINTNDGRNWSILHAAAYVGNNEFVEFLIKKGADTNAVEEYENTPLHLAAQNDKIDVVKVLVANGANINAKNARNLSILHIAAYVGNKKIVEFLINKGADINAENENGFNPLYLAVQNEKIEVVKVFVANGANINAKNASNLSILHIAAENGYKEIVEFLVNKGADTNAVNIGGTTPLCLAVKNEKIEVIKLLVDNGANINANINNNWSNLHVAVENGYKEIVEFLINKGADTNAVNIDGITPLYLAVQNEKIEVVKLLVDNGANINAKTAINWSILHIAAEKGNLEIVEFLITNEADTNADNNNGETPLYLSVQNEKIEVVKVLVDNGANINANENNIWSILHVAAMKGNREMVEFFINKGADINAVNIDGITPLYLAVQNEKIEVVKVLVTNSANINAKNAKNLSILHIAAYVGNKTILEFLINKGADINAENENGFNPLYLAVQNEKIEVVKVLLANSANINAKNASNLSILHIAAEKGYKEIVEFLINKGADTNAVNIDGITPLYLAVQNEKIEVVRLLVDNGTNINAKTAINSSILHIAAEKGNKEIVEFLINNGADTNAENNNAETSLCLAVQNEKIEVVKLLVANGANINANKNDNWSILHVAAENGNKEIVEFLINKGADTNAVDENGRTPWHVSIDKGNDEVSKLLDETGNA